MNIYDLISRAQKLRKETQLDSVSPDRVGGLQEDTLKYINEFQLLASSPSLHKLYASVSAMQSDKSPKSDLTGKPLKPGQLVVIVPADQSDATAGDVYRYDGPSGNTSAWTFVAKIGAVPADAELSATSANPVQNKVVTEKLTELESEIYRSVALEVQAENSAITQNGEVVTANNFRIYAPVFFKEGTNIKILANGYNLSVLSLLNENGTYTPMVIQEQKAGDVNTYYYTIPQDGKYVISSGKYWTGVADFRGELYANEIDLVSAETQGLADNMYSQVELSRALFNKAITDKGEVVSANNFSIYHPIFLTKGTRVKVRSNGDSLAAFSLLNDDGTYTPLVVYPTKESIVNDAYYIIPKDGAYVVSSGKFVGADGVAFYGELYVSNFPQIIEMTKFRLGQDYKAITDKGELVSTTPHYMVSAPFVLRKGQPIRVHYRGRDISVLSKIVGNEYIPIIPTTYADLQEGISEYCAKADGVYVITSQEETTMYSDRPIYYISEISVPMVAGNFIDMGVQRGVVTDSAHILHSFVTENFIQFDGGLDTIFSANLEDGESLQIQTYDASFKRMNIVSSFSAIPTTTKYIKLWVSKASAYPYRQRNLSIVIANKDGICRYVKNDITDANGTKGVTPYWVSYEIVKPTIGVKEDGSYNGNNNVRCWNNGYVVLPPNYEKEGKPVPLIIVGHGTNCYSFGQNSIYWYGDLISFLARNGFAVADCSTTSSLYPNQKDANTPTPLAMTCYKGLYECVCSRFNIDKENVFMFGHSAGGMLTSIFSFQQPFPLKAVASMAGSLELITNMRILTPYTDHTFFLEQIGVDASGFPQINDAMAAPNAAAKEIYLKNADKLIGYNPFTIGSAGIDNAELCKAAAEMPFPYGAENDQAMNAIVAKGYKMCPVPMKIWHAVDDDKVPFSMSKFYQQIVQNAGGRCEVRPLPEGTGKHGSVDVAENAPRTNYMTKCGIEMNVAVAYAEMVDWFNSFLL